MSLEHVQKIEDIRVQHEKVSNELIKYNSSIRSAKTADAEKEFKSFLSEKRFVVKDPNSGYSATTSKVITAVYGTNLSFKLQIPDANQNLLGGPRLTLEVKKDATNNVRTFLISIAPPSTANTSSVSVSVAGRKPTPEEEIEKAQNDLNNTQEFFQASKDKTWLYHCIEQVSNNNRGGQRGQAPTFAKAFATFTELLSGVEKEVFGE